VEIECPREELQTWQASLFLLSLPAGTDSRFLNEQLGSTPACDEFSIWIATVGLRLSRNRSRERCELKRPISRATISRLRSTVSPRRNKYHELFAVFKIDFASAIFHRYIYDHSPLLPKEHKSDLFSGDAQKAQRATVVVVRVGAPLSRSHSACSSIP
jgi:hypothetical protein